MKAYKIEVLIVDHDEIGPTSIQNAIENSHYPNRCIMPSVMGMECKDIGDWSDDHPLNKITQMKSEFERVFK